jgi:hypothetical protein
MQSPYPMQMLQTDQYLIMAFEYMRLWRVIPIGKPHPDRVEPSFMGDSVAHWEGDTLVIDTTGFNDLSWFDRAGNYHSDALHVVERLTPMSADLLNYEATVDDKKVFSRPWKISMPIYRRKEKGARLLEFRCVEFVEDLVYGALRKPGARATQ